MINILKSIIKFLARKNRFVNGFYLKVRQLYFQHCFSDITLIQKQFKKGVGREVDLQNPIKYNDKLQWLKLHWYDSLAIKSADKFQVRKIVKDLVGDEYLNELYGVYETLEEINLDSLPDSFVLKGTHGSGFNLICEDKSQMNWKLAFKEMRIWLKTNYFWQNREWVYKEMKPRIISEKFLSDDSGKPPMDYKIFCFHGEPKLIQVDIDRFGGHRQNFYDISWNFRDVEIWCSNDKAFRLPKPKGLNEMLDISRKLSKPFPHVRVDLYNIEGNIIFGELTFFHQSGIQKFRDEELELEMGSWLHLERINKDGVYIG